MTGPVDAARLRAKRLYPRSKGFQAAYRAGARAAREGRPTSACPYAADLAKTWRNVWKVAWMRGYASESGDLDAADR